MFLFILYHGRNTMSDLIYKRNRKRYLLLILPAFILYTFTLVIPLLGGTFPNALTNWNLMKGTKQFVGLDNYIRLLQDKNFQQAIVFTLILGIVTIIFTNLLAFITAFFLSEKIFGGSISRAMFFLPNIISGVMVSYVWYFIFTRAIPDVGKMLSNHFLSNISWFGTPGFAFAATTIVSVWQGTGFLMILYIAGLQTIPKDVLEAAKLDGCVGIKKIAYIELPLLMTTVTVNLFVSIANSFKAFDIPFALTGGGPGGSTQTIALDIYNDAFGSFRYGYASAKSVILFLMVAAVTLVQLWITRKKEVQA
jgi:raffinose/stachyose/melibiose transport system permease protein|nr:sugar ABC transporter permease [uncultured Blautia sp.]